VSKDYYVVLSVESWDQVQAPLNRHRISLDLPKGCVGFLMAFDNRKDAERWGKGLPVQQCHSVKETDDAQS